MLTRLFRTEPVRLYGVLAAAVPLLTYLLPSGAWLPALGLAGAVLGVNQAVRARVWSPDSHDLAVDQALRLNPHEEN